VTNDLTLWGIGTSRTMRVHWMLIELGLEYEFHPIQSRSGETRTDGFKLLNPRHKIPVLRHRSLVLTESAAIINYLSDTVANPKSFYVPSEPNTRAKLSEWCYFIVSELDASSLYVVRRHDSLRQIYGHAPVAVESAKDYFLHNIESMAAPIGDREPYLFGELLSVADILLTTCLDWAATCGIHLPEIPARYRKRVALRPGYQAALKRNFVDYQDRS